MGMFDFIEDKDVREKAEAAHTAGVTAEVKTQVEAGLGDAVSKAVEKEVGGLKVKNADLLKEKKDMKKLLEGFKGVDLEAAKDAMKFLATNEEAKLLKEGKFEEIIEKRTSGILTEHETTVGDLRSKLKIADEMGTTYKGKYEKKVVSDDIRNAALKAGVRVEALDDVLSRGGDVFSLGDDGTVEARDDKGNLKKFDEDIILNPKNWIETLKKVAPHYWPASEGIDAGGDGTADDLTVAMNAAAVKGDMKEYRRLRDKAHGKDKKK